MNKGFVMRKVLWINNVNTQEGENFIFHALPQVGFSVDWVRTWERAVDLLTSEDVRQEYAIIFLPVNSGGRGIGIIQHLKEQGISTPIFAFNDIEQLPGGEKDTTALFLEGNEDTAAVEALNAGADHFQLLGSFGSDGLIAHTQALLRRSNHLKGKSESCLCFGDMRINVSSQEITIGPQRLLFNRAQSNVVCWFARNLDRVFPVDVIHEHISSSNGGAPPKSNAVCVFILRVRDIMAKNLGISRAETPIVSGWRKGGGSTGYGMISPQEWSKNKTLPRAFFEGDVSKQQKEV